MYIRVKTHINFKHLIWKNLNHICILPSVCVCVCEKDAENLDVEIRCACVLGDHFDKLFIGSPVC